MRFHHNHDLPDAGQGWCCMGAVMRGPGGCTCWDDKHDRRQSKTLKPGPPAVRTEKCEDCAFRKGSPETQGDTRFALSGDGELQNMLDNPHAVFYCHQGMRRITKRVHPTGATVDAAPGEYDPPGRDCLPYKANGQPAEICAGFAAARKWRP